MKTKKEIIEAIKENALLNDHLDENALSCLYDAQPDDEIDLDTFRGEAEQYIYESVQIIYYHHAIDYLKENDPSLMESIEIAGEFCTPLENINSEFLASILLQRNCQDELSSIISDLEAV